MTTEQATLQEVAATLGEVYFIRKDAEDEQKALRELFFKAAAEEKESQELAWKTVAVPIAEEDPEAYALQYHPGWIIGALPDQPDEKFWRVELVEDPDLIPFSIVVETEEQIIDPKGKTHYGYVITKEIRTGSAMVDLDRMQRDDPDLYREITYWDGIVALEDLCYHANIDSDDIESYLDDRLPAYGWKRLVKNPDDMTPDQLTGLRKYTYEGPKIKALKVRYAKPEELGEG